MWDTCLNYCQTKITEAHQQKNTLAEATFYKLVGGTYYNIPEKDKVVEYWNKSVVICLANNYNVLLEKCYHNIGTVFLDKGLHLDSAESYLQKAYSMGLVNHAKAAPENLLHGRVLATLYERMDKLNEAEKLYVQTIANCEEAKDTTHIAETMMFYSEVLTKKKEYDKALKTSEKALEISRKTNQIDMVCTALTLHAENLSAAGKYKEAYLCKNELVDLIVKRYSGDFNTKISEAEAKFKNAETTYEKEVAILKAKKKTQIYLLSFLGLLLVTSFGFYYVYQKRNAKQKLQIKQTQIQSILDGEEKERTRIAKDLHDGIVQNLTSIKLQLNASINKKDIVDKKVVVDAVDSIDKASKEVRNISYQMMPATLIQLGFIPAIENLLKRVFTPSNIKYDFEQIGITERLPEKIEVSIFRITQELLNNVLKHSEANFVSLLITLKANVVTMIFEDNGKGFDVTTIKKGIGFSSLSSRVELLNGDIKYEKGDGVGTMAIVKIPVYDLRIN